MCGSVDGFWGIGSTLTGSVWFGALVVTDAAILLEAVEAPRDERAVNGEPARADPTGWARLTSTVARLLRAGVTAYELGRGSASSGPRRKGRFCSTRMASEKPSTERVAAASLAAAHPVLHEVGGPDRHDDDEDEAALHEGLP